MKLVLCDKVSVSKIHLILMKSQIAHGSGPLQAMMRHCWPSSGPDKMDVSLKWPTCKIANMAQISQIKCGPFLVKMRCSQVCVFWMWASSGLFLVDIWLACGADLGNRRGPPKCHHSTRYVGRMKVLKVSGVGRIWATAILLSGITPPHFQHNCGGQTEVLS